MCRIQLVLMEYFAIDEHLLEICAQVKRKSTGYLVSKVRRMDGEVEQRDRERARVGKDWQNK